MLSKHLRKHETNDYCISTEKIYFFYALIVPTLLIQVAVTHIVLIFGTKSKPLQAFRHAR